MAILTVLQAAAVPEPQRDYNFDVTFPSINGALAPQCEAIDLPFYSVNADSYLINFRRHNTAGRFVLTNFSATFMEDDAGTAAAWWNAWLNLIRFPNGTYNYPTTYKQTVTAILVDVMLQTVNTITYLGVFPVVAAPYRLKSALNGRIVMEASFLADEVQSVITGGGGGGGAAGGLATGGVIV